MRVKIGGGGQIDNKNSILCHCEVGNPVE